MDLLTRIGAFAELGKILEESIAGKPAPLSDRFNYLVENQWHKNGWFTPKNIVEATAAIAENLTIEKLNQWVARYPSIEKLVSPLNIGIIMAGNIPLVGFHDFLCVLLTGNRVIVKRSSKDADLITYITDLLIHINPEFSELIRLTEGKMEGFDAVIATGSDNSSRYFEYYFGKYPNIIRKNRNSIAILNGNETPNELLALGKDIFAYFGLGCRSISKLFVPKGYGFGSAIEAWAPFSGIINNSKYGNNYDYYKAIFLINKDKFLDTGFMLIKEDLSSSSPVSVLYFEQYNTPEDLERNLFLMKDSLQCIVGYGHTQFGEAQRPSLWDYADGIDTVEFILKINKH